MVSKLERLRTEQDYIMILYSAIIARAAFPYLASSMTPKLKVTAISTTIIHKQVPPFLLSVLSSFCSL